MSEARAWLYKGRFSKELKTKWALEDFKRELRDGNLKRVQYGRPYLLFIRRATINWIAEGEFSQERYGNRQNFAATLHKSISDHLR